MKKNYWVKGWVLGIFFGVQSFGFVFAQTAKSPELVQAWEDVNILASPKFAGRGYQQKGHLKAARYIAERFEAMGLDPIPDPKDPKTPYFQYFDLSLHLPRKMKVCADKQKWEVGTDFIVNTISGSGNIKKGSVVDAGYALDGDFPNVGGKVAVVRSGLPEEINADKEKKKAYAEQAADAYKVALLERAGAVAVVILKPKLTAGIPHGGAKIPVIDAIEDLADSKFSRMSITVEMEASKIQSQNILGFIKGSTAPDSAIIVSAHYDHLGKQGKAIFNGANDNASGTAVIMALAAHYAKPENVPDYTMVFVGFGGEEAGLVGSRHYVQNDPVWPLARTKFILNLDLMGNGDEGITAVGGKVYPGILDEMKELNEQIQATPKVKARGNAANSDHYFFLENGVPGFFIYTMGGPPHYHDVNDIAANLRFSNFDELNRLFIAFLDKMQQNWLKQD